MAAQRPPRRKDDVRAERVAIPFSHAALTANATLKAYLVPTGREFVLDRVTYNNDTGLAADAANTFRGEVQNSNGGAIAATLFNTDSDDDPAGAALATGWTTGTLSATTANLWFDAGESVDVVLTEEGTATLPAGNGVIEGYLY